MKWANSSDNAARMMDAGSLDGGEDDEHSGIGFVEISETTAMQDAVLFET